MNYHKVFKILYFKKADKEVIKPFEILEAAIVRCVNRRELIALNSQCFVKKGEDYKMLLHSFFSLLNKISRQRIHDCPVNSNLKSIVQNLMHHQFVTLKPRTKQLIDEKPTFNL